ncbi:MAG: DUF3352 domain-containing protein [Winogradskyella sp.]
MKKKILLFLILAIVISGISLIAYKLYFNSNDNIQSIYLVPKDAVYIFETETPLNNWSAISDSKIWQHLNTNSYFNNLAESLNQLDTIFKKQKGIFNTIGERNIIVSAHIYAPKKYSFLYIIDLQKIAKLNIIKNNINALVSDGFKVSKRNYHNHKITEVYNKESRETIYISFIKNQMIASFAHTILEQSIDEYLEPTIGRNLNFIDIKKEVGYTGMFNLYLQHNYITDFIKLYSTSQNSITSLLSTDFDFSGFSFNIDGNNIFANGLTASKPTASPYIKALLKSGKGTRSLSKIAPKNTASYTHFAFESFETFYDNFESIQKENIDEFKLFLDRKVRVENYLKINFKTNVINWIDNEMALFQIPSNISKTENDIAIVLKSKSAEQAKTQLNFISEQIRKKSPVKFKALDYKGFTINFLSVKGFFKAFIGNMFNAIDKPYYTIIDDYVIFSNTPNTLKNIINNYRDGTTLANSENFKDFNKKLDNKCSVFTYINTPQLYSTLFNFADFKTKQQLSSNKNYITCFKQIGLQLSPEDYFFETNLAIEFAPIKDLKPIKTAVVNSKIETKNNKTTLNEATLFDIPEIFPTDLTAKIYTKKRNNGSIDFSVGLKNGVLNGTYKAYYPNGNLKMTGRYRKGKQSGTWRAYNENEDLIVKKRF